MESGNGEMYTLHIFNCLHFGGFITSSFDNLLTVGFLNSYWNALFIAMVPNICPYDYAELNLLSHGRKMSDYFYLLLSVTFLEVQMAEISVILSSTFLF